MSQQKEHLPKIRIGELLLQKGLINPTQLRQALILQRDSELKLGEILIQQGLISYEQLQQVLTEQRWRNWVTSVLLSVSTLTPHLPQLVSNAEVQASTTYSNHSSAVEFITDNPSQGKTGRQNQGGISTQSSPSKVKTLFAAATPIPSKPTVASPLRGFCHPLNGQGWLSQGIRGTTHQGRMEYAYDLAVSIGTPIYAMRPGKVIALRDKYPDTGGGKENAARYNFVWIEHEDGYRSIYVHLQQGFRDKVNLRAGDHVEAGQLIGYSGNSGWSSGPHLHVEVQTPSRKQRFTQTVPFAISGTCNGEEYAQESKDMDQQ
ncbi:M23 family metallopeptidase [Acaryochloris sp. IP29b_bin.148]|uniref:M23 family metallopeptidase n=1 Tax=Acaryochloris sp. IP29b_bin.148 TaxID=2969218 RepID=UPI00260319A0|nr:M23 family metallopeptidase [Acaryochloris sp. IP29b_bin.148]